MGVITRGVYDGGKCPGGLTVLLPKSMRSDDRSNIHEKVLKLSSCAKVILIGHVLNFMRI